MNITVARFLLENNVYKDCGMVRIPTVYYEQIMDALKEQEAKPLIENERGWNCSYCGMKLMEKTASGYPCDLIDLPEDEPIHFCPMCGQAVKWE